MSGKSSSFGPTISGISLPSNCRGHRKNKKSRKTIKKEGMAKCAEYYNILQNEAIPATAAYIIAYERAIEASEAAERQLKEAMNSTSEIEEEFKDDMINEITDLIAVNTEYRSELSARCQKLNDLFNEFNRFSEEIIRRNTILNDMSMEVPYARGHNRY